jgi:hypothetical protein
MPPFYSRYVPDSSGAPANSVKEGFSSSSKKRKLDDEHTTPRQDIKKTKKSLTGNKIAHGKLRDAHHEAPVIRDHAESVNGTNVNGSHNILRHTGDSSRSSPVADGGEQPAQNEKKDRKPKDGKRDRQRFESLSTIEVEKQKMRRMNRRRRKRRKNRRSRKSSS